MWRYITMKKIISVFLAITMLFSFAAVAFAADETATYECTCTNCRKDVDCTCCIYCEYTGKRMSCVTFDEDNGGVAVFCCERCTGFLGCTCGDEEDPEALCVCTHCRAEAQDGKDPAGSQNQIFDSDTQKSIIDMFQNILGKISAVFDMIFDAIFEFLRIDELQPKA